MKPLMPNDPETKSADILAETIERPKMLFPKPLLKGRLTLKF
jgi:hypothetical protein